MKKKYRYELKFIVPTAMVEILGKRLAMIMDIDRNAHFEDGSYLVKSLYFDDIYNASYHEKIDGVLHRKKYRIRLYNDNEDFIRLECKMKDNNMTSKRQVQISKEVANALITNDPRLITVQLKENDLLTDFILDMKTQKLTPSVIVEYRRLAFTYPISDVRINFDINISSGLNNYDLFDSDINKIPIIPEDKVVLEVKFNDFLPEPLAIILQDLPAIRSAVSKFAFCANYK